LSATALPHVKSITYSEPWHAAPTPVLSFVVPAYHTQHYIQQTLDSLIDATPPRIEIIVVHDGGNDETLACALQWQQDHPDQSMAVIDRDNGGLSAARHTGALLARGRYLAFCDSDDFVDLKTYLDMAHLADTHGCEVVLCRAVAFDSQSGFTHDFYDASVFESIVGSQSFVVTDWRRHPQLFSLEPNANLRILKRRFLSSKTSNFR